MKRILVCCLLWLANTCAADGTQEIPVCAETEPVRIKFASAAVLLQRMKQLPLPEVMRDSRWILSDVLPDIAGLLGDKEIVVTRETLAIDIAHSILWRCGHVAQTGHCYETFSQEKIVQPIVHTLLTDRQCHVVGSD